MSDADRRTPEEVRREIAATRDQLADTAAALAAKADVKQRARERVDGVKEDVRSRVTEARNTVSSRAHEVKDSLAGTDDAATGRPAAGTGGMAGTMPRAAAPDSAAGSLGASAATAGHVAGGAATAAKQQMRAHPLPSAAIAAALLGFVLGYLLARR